METWIFSKAGLFLPSGIYANRPSPVPPIFHAYRIIHNARCQVRWVRNLVLCCLFVDIGLGLVPVSVH